MSTVFKEIYGETGNRVTNQRRWAPWNRKETGAISSSRNLLFPTCFLAGVLAAWYFAKGQHEGWINISANASYIHHIENKPCKFLILQTFISLLVLNVIRICASIIRHFNMQSFADHTQSNEKPFSTIWYFSRPFWRKSTISDTGTSRRSFLTLTTIKNLTRSGSCDQGRTLPTVPNNSSYG